MARVPMRDGKIDADSAVPVVRFVEPAGGVTKCSWSISRCSVAAAMRSVTSAVPAGVAKSGPLTVRRCSRRQGWMRRSQVRRTRRSRMRVRRIVIDVAVAARFQCHCSLSPLKRSAQRAADCRPTSGGALPASCSDRPLSTWPLLWSASALRVASISPGSSRLKVAVAADSELRGKQQPDAPVPSALILLLDETCAASLSGCRRFPREG